ncbi:MAG: type II secretion system protein [Candidatus Omnitrophica bacterium]|nr:type II secretion system protein [Candidatus Omnitrophota bacterium]MDD5655333.1 type II secretion system protein [Candidatus Omnitrophota bacterium]
MLRAKKGFTLLEIMVATIILSLIMAGLASLFYGAKRWVLHARMRMQATQVSKSYLDPLQRNVRQDQWNPASNCLSTDGAAGCDAAVETIEGIQYTPAYVVGAPPFGGNNKKVRFTITWNEPTP